MWVDLDETEHLNDIHWAFGTKPFRVLRFNEADYLPTETGNLKERATAAIAKLGVVDDVDKVFILCQGRCFGFYFSPVNFYFYKGADGSFRYMVAEVSNTPWNERHHYLIPLNKNNVNHAKVFHVSPFMDLAMDYHWQVYTDQNLIRIVIDNYRESTRIFNASLKLERKPLSSKSVKSTLMTFPAMTFSVMKGIYWHALRLFIKKVPFIPHPGK